jgi:hypothetical protein
LRSIILIEHLSPLLGGVMSVFKINNVLDKILKTVNKAYTPTNEYKQIRKLSNEIKQIENETKYIKETGQKPTPTPNYMKYLNIIK